MNQLIDAPTQTVSTCELLAALEHELSRHFGARRGIARLERRFSDYSSSFPIEELDVRLDDGRTLQLMFKNLSREAMLEEASRIRPAFLYNPLREIEAYLAILAPNRMAATTCYGAVVNHQAGRYWLFLRKVFALQLRHVGGFTTWEQVARWLATMHNRCASKRELLAQAGDGQLLHYNGDLFR